MIPLSLEVGATALLPWEAMAGNDIERVRDRYPCLGIMGGIDKTALLSKESIDRELAKAARMIAQGGYIPHVDYANPPNVTWENFKYYRERLNDIVGAVKVRPPR